ncbi:type II toxin-antitoxin system VapC family toxin [Lachnospiraceae bacterium 47-T17]
MKVLIDTHIALWALMDDPKMPKEAEKILMDENNDIYYSTVSVWEVAIKHSIRPDAMIVDGRLFEKGCEDNGYKVLPIFNRHTFVLDSLKRPDDAPKHNDPFDRLLICQSKTEGMRFLTHDSLLSDYGEECMIYV